MSARFIDILQSELTRIDALDLDADARHKLSRSWRQKLEHARAGDHRWGRFRARKPEADRPESTRGKR